MKRCLAALVFLASAFSTLPAQDQEAGGVGEAYKEKGYKAKTSGSGIQALSVSSYNFGDPTAQEQQILELVNRARANPTAEAQRYGITLNQGLPTGTISTAPKPPLVFDARLIAAARAHTQWMLNTDTFSHTGTNGTNSKDRMELAGYPFTGSWGAGENLAWSGTQGTVDVNKFTLLLHQQLIVSPTHRENVMEPLFDQIGIGVLQGEFFDTEKNKTFNALMCTEDFATSASSPSPEGPFVTGVAYNDLNSNGAYDIGEGLGGVTVNLLPGDTTTTTASAGGYAIPLGSTSGALVLTFSGGAVTTATNVTATAVPGINVKADLVISTKIPVIGLSGDLNFGSVTVGGSSSKTLTITNSGNGPLVVAGISHSSGVFTGNFSGTIGAGISKPMTITFTPTALQAFSGTLSVASNAASGASTKVETGTGVTAPTVSTPVINPAGASFSRSVKVKLTCPTTGAVIRFTTTGAEPTASSKKYTRAITLKATTTIKAKAFKAGFTDSATASATFTKN